MNIKVIGTGAAGNKSVIQAIEEGAISQSNVLLINSTDVDIPFKWRDKDFVYLLSDKAYGCAKEASTAEELTIRAIDKNIIPLDEFCDGADEVIINTSCMGGTGTGSTPVIADYIAHQIGIPVRIIPFVGFGVDETELKNVVSFFTKLSEDYIIEEICNSKFLSEADNNYAKAEKLANKEFIRKLILISGKSVVESEQNIDRADLLKTIKTPGHAYSLYSEFEIIKNVDEYNKMISTMIDNTKSFDITTGTQTRMAVILSLPSSTTEENIDLSHTELKKRLGKVKDVYTHIQHKNPEDDPTNGFIIVLSSGSLFPKEAIDLYYKKYQEAKVYAKQESFFTNNNYVIDDDDESVYDKRKRGSSKFFNKNFKSSNSEVAATNESKLI